MSVVTSVLVIYNTLDVISIASLHWIMFELCTFIVCCLREMLTGVEYNNNLRDHGPFYTQILYKIFSNVHATFVIMGVSNE
ncbi:unnamed protein product [Acanthoscelides obtectus]|uniref:Uncharacterized protein n=1 Tax=Acanthoscelides obtectus TaxID=200917 RepID=A0A9P0L3M0_ACAOB|nr:unnamed protein product [Acanthoscelides obtectus]CAK1673067.1 hypothetical protein AOBTE_LOCUS29229 [Acanthoscelides obtectus]